MSSFAGVDLSRWNGSATLRLVRFPDVASSTALSTVVDGLHGEAELQRDRDGRIVAVLWPDEQDAAGPARLDGAYDAAADRLDLRLTEEPVARSCDVLDGVRVDLDAEGRIAGVTFTPAGRLLPGATIEAIAAGPEEVALPPAPEPPDEDEDEPQVSETFTCSAGALSWRSLVADLEERARMQRLGFTCSLDRHGPFGTLGADVACVVTGRPSQLALFAEFAEERVTESRGWFDWTDLVWWLPWR